jgi:outer membrane translocation and assembly module TamA
MGSRAEAAQAARIFKKVELCPSFTVIGALSPGLSDVEKRMVCGDPKSDSWKTIPKNQARFNFSTFMQDRALYHVHYTEEPASLIAELGPPTYVSRLTWEGAPPHTEIERKRLIIGQKLTPLLLDTIEQWTIKRLGAIGYPCAKVKSHADPDTGEVHLVITPGPRLNLIGVHEVDTPGLAKGVIRRYDAFRLGTLYDGDNLVTTSNRIVSQGLFDSSFFIPACQADGAFASQEIVSSPPRLLSLQAGVNTEEYLVGRAIWTESRIGKNGSALSVQLYASFKSQQISSHLDDYVFDPGSRQALRPYISIDHENWSAYETGTFTAQFAHETSWDGGTPDLGFKVITGPELDEIRTYRGVGPSNSHFLSLMSSWTMMTHDFEFYSDANAPRTGYSATANLAFTNQSLYSTVSVQRLDLRWEGLWNYRDYDPPLFVFGLRAGYDTTVTGERPSFANIYGVLIPPTYLHFLGGSRDLRGFGVQELPLQPAGTQSGDQIGSLTDAFVSFETRLVATLPWGFEPFAFLDVGALGNTPWSLIEPIYWDPGIGLRLQSPIGVFRATLAHGFIGTTPDHYQFYFSFGQEF